MIILKNEWENCKICNLELNDLVKKYGGNGIYKTQCFKKHIENDHGITIDEYFGINQTCPCGVCNKPLKIKISGANFELKKMACGRNDGVLKWAEEAKKSRTGKNNPMYQKKPWNLGLTKETSSSLKIVSEKRTGTTPSEETKKKQSDSAKKRKVHGHTGHKHSDETKNKLRDITLANIKNGLFKQVDTLPSRLFEKLLIDNQIKYEKEKIVQAWSFDFYLIDYDYYVEIDGDYFHSNPLIYKDGPKTKTQKINHYRDRKKNEFCLTNNLNLVRFWEQEILGDINCVLQKLLELLQLEQKKQ